MGMCSVSNVGEMCKYALQFHSTEPPAGVSALSPIEKLEHSGHSNNLRIKIINMRRAPLSLVIMLPHRSGDCDCDGTLSPWGLSIIAILGLVHDLRAVKRGRGS